jgi:tRNA (adenine57-N1/adenine58-N1)-methyltransferase
MTTFRLGEWVLLASQKGKTWLVQVEDAPFSSHLGTINMMDLLQKTDGDSIETNKGSRLFLWRPSLEEYIYKMKRKTQVIYPKDLGAVIFYSDIQPGDTVLESGIGAGALTLGLLRIVGEHGKVISVEKRPEFALLSVENITKFQGRYPNNLQIVVADIQHFAMTEEVDRVFLDLPEPWRAVGPVSRLLRPGGVLINLSPNVGQVQLTFRELKHHGFANITNFELLRRDWMVDELRARPVDRMRAHTLFITVAKKMSAPVES